MGFGIANGDGDLSGETMSAMLPQFSDIVWPDAPAYWIANARVPLCMLGEARPPAQYDGDDGIVLVDLLIESERLARMVPAGTAGTAQHPRIDLRGRQVADAGGRAYPPRSRSYRCPSAQRLRLICRRVAYDRVRSAALDA